jgi:hypothetical protein
MQASFQVHINIALFLSTLKVPILARNKFLLIWFANIRMSVRTRLPKRLFNPFTHFKMLQTVCHFYLIGLLYGKMVVLHV